MNNCFTAVCHWFAVNGLALNPNKSEAVVIGTDERQRAEGAVNTGQLGADFIKVSGCVRSLGITIDGTLSFNTHVNEICKAVHYHTQPWVTFLNLSQMTTPNSLLLHWYPLDWTTVIQFFTRRHSPILQNFNVFKTASPTSLPEHENVIISHRFLLTSTGCQSLHALSTRSLC
jgi:hypothetical protein